MRTAILTVAAVLAGAAPLPAQTITASPTRFYQVPPFTPLSEVRIDLTGAGITAAAERAGGDFRGHIRVQMKRPGSDYEDVVGSGWSHDLVSVRVPGTPWLNVPGMLSLRLLIDGAPTNAVEVAVLAAPTSAPVITTVTPGSFAPGTADLFTVRGLNFSEPITVTVAGREASLGSRDVNAGELRMHFPAELRGRSGRYGVVVTTRAGASLAHYVEVAGPPVVVAVEPGEVVKERAGDGAAVRVKVRFEGAGPTSARVGNDVLGWAAVATPDWADSPTAVWIDVPMTMVQKVAYPQPQEVQIVLSNASGSSTGTLTVSSDGSALRVIPGARPGTTIVRPPEVNVPPVRRPPRPPRP